MDRWQGALGLVVIFALAWLLSENRRAAGWRVAVVGIVLQLAIAALLLHVPPLRAAFGWLNAAALALQEASVAGSGFVFGYLGGAPLPFEERQPGASFILAFRALPLVIVVSALTALLTYWRVLPLIVKGFAFVFERSLRVGGAVSLSAAANIFVGMVEAPLFVRPYVGRLSRGELFMVMTCGMATIAGTVLVLYAAILTPVLPDAIGHLLVASIISVPAAIAIARLMVPAAGTATEATLHGPSEARGAVDAITRGAQSGMQLFLSIVALLLVMVALVHLANAVLGLLPDVSGAALSLQRILGWIMAPLVWLIGVPWAEATTAGALMGVKTVLNEFLAYLQLAALPADALSDRSRLIMTYAMCGFANFGSLGIMLGGLSAIAPERRDEIVALGLKSIVAGTLATLSTGAVVGLVAF